MFMCINKPKAQNTPESFFSLATVSDCFEHNLNSYSSGNVLASDKLPQIPNLAPYLASDTLAFSSHKIIWLIKLSDLVLKNLYLHQLIYIKHF